MLSCTESRRGTLYPSRYLTCDTAIVMAAPDVKAYVTGVLMNEMSQPRRRTPTAV